MSFEPIVLSKGTDVVTGPLDNLPTEGGTSHAPLTSLDQAANAIAGNKFAFSPSHLFQLIDNRNPKSLGVFGGLRGLEKGLRTDLKAGLSVEEDVLDGVVSLDGTVQRGAADAPKDPHHAHHTSILSSTHRSTPGQFTDRRDIFGINRVPKRKPRSFLRLLWLAFNDKLIFLLTASATISLVLAIYQAFTSDEAGSQIEWVEGVAIVAAIIVIVFSTAINDWQKNYRFQKLNQKKDERNVTVTRSGKHRSISIYDVVVGDVLHIEAGDVVPADGVLIEGFDVQCDESSLTGESDLVGKVSAHGADTQEKEAGDPFILSGTKVETGVGTLLVLSVGINTAYGKIMMSLQDDVQETPLQQKLGRVAKKIIQFGGVAGIIAFTVLFIRYLVNLDTIEGGAQGKGREFLDVLIFSVTVVVIAVPEGLSLTVALALAFATTRMLKDNNLVRLVRSCETMGNATTVCSDKTGTLTQNKMNVVAGLIGTSDEFVHGAHVAEHQEQSTLPTAAKYIASLHAEFKDLLKTSFALNSTAIETGDDGEYMGSSTETALLKFARTHLGMGTVSEERGNAEVVQLVPFDSKRKWMAIVIKLSNGKFRILVKGAGEVILGKCSDTVQSPQDGLSITSLLPGAAKKLNDMMTSYAHRSLRVVSLAYRDVDTWTLQKDSVAAEHIKDLVFIGAMGIRDPLRPGVVESVQLCQMAGVFVRMVTGDNFTTATTIAEECGIYTAGGVAMDGPTFRRLTPEQLDLVIPRLQVLARSSPDDKMRLVTHLKGLNEVVAVTGDGTNDALALKAADIGFSMGISGTEVAKEASAIVLMDDNFASIVKAIGWGRAVNEAAKKFLQFQFTINISAGTLSVISAFVSGPDAAIFSIIHLLWINLIMDTLAALALGTDWPTRGLMLKKPEPRTASILNTTMWKMITGQAIYQMLVIFIFHYAGQSLFGYRTATQMGQLQTMTFNVYMWMQFFNQTNCRRIDNRFNILEGAHMNPWFILVQVVTLAGQIVIVFVGGDAFHTTRLNGAQWGWSLLFGTLTIPLGALIRCIPDEPLRRAWLALAKKMPKINWRKKRQDDEEEVRKPGVVKKLGGAVVKIFRSSSDDDKNQGDDSGREVSQSLSQPESADQGEGEPFDLVAAIETAKLGGPSRPAGLSVHADTEKEDPVLLDLSAEIGCPTGTSRVPPSQRPEVHRFVKLAKE